VQATRRRRTLAGRLGVPPEVLAQLGSFSAHQQRNLSHLLSAREWRPHLHRDPAAPLPPEALRLAHAASHRPRLVALHKGSLAAATPVELEPPAPPARASAAARRASMPASLPRHGEAPPAGDASARRASGSGPAAWGGTREEERAGAARQLDFSPAAQASPRAAARSPRSPLVPWQRPLRSPGGRRVQPATETEPRPSVRAILRQEFS
jgi:hypothetical protein